VSFSEDIKNEILMTKNKKCCVLPLRYGELITESTDIKVGDIKKITLVVLIMNLHLSNI